MTLHDLLRDRHVRRGARDMLAFGPGLGAWGLVTGVAMTQSGLGVPLSLLMSLTVYAGSAQLASLQWRVHLGHLTRGRRLALGYLLADLNLVVFQNGIDHRV